jgi:hypothetical protein
MKTMRGKCEMKEVKASKNNGNKQGIIVNSELKSMRRESPNNIKYPPGKDVKQTY